MKELLISQHRIRLGSFLLTNTPGHPSKDDFSLVPRPVMLSGSILLLCHREGDPAVAMVGHMGGPGAV